jgi:site-specific recombinase XerD
MKPTDFSKSLTDFLRLYLPGERGVSHNTILAYKDTFMLFINFIKRYKSISVDKLTLQSITQQWVIEFLNWLQTERECSNATRNARLAALHSFFRYLQYCNPVHLYEWQRILAIPLKKSEKPIISYLSMDAIKLLLEQPDQQNPKQKRDLALLSLMYDSGARVQEIIDLQPSSINFNKPCTIKLTGKGNKSRIVPLMDAQVRMLNSYMQGNRLLESYAGNYYLFSNGRSEKFTRMGVTLILKKYTEKARKIDLSLFPQNVTPHVLRHSKAMHMLQAGVNLVYIRDFLGHTSISTTEIYARADSKLKRQAIEKAYSDISQTKNLTESSWMKDADLLQWLKELK